MPHSAIVTFTAKPLQRLLQDGGSGDWRLDPERASKAEYLVCTQNRHNIHAADAALWPADAPHGAAFLVGRIARVVPAPAQPDRWLITISEFSPCNIPNIWTKSGHLRYPIRYTTLEELGIDLAALPPFRPLPAVANRGLSDAAGTLLMPPWPRVASRPAQPQGTDRQRPRKPAAAAQPTDRWDAQGDLQRDAQGGSQGDAHPDSQVDAQADAQREAQARLDALLAQFDRIPDLPAPADPLAWDEHGLPQ